MFELRVVIQNIYKLLLFNNVLYLLLLNLALIIIYCIWESKGRRLLAAIYLM